jgi:predicted nucleic acid-binding protein
MIYYFDNSALVWLFNNEQGSTHVQEIVNNSANDIWVLELAMIELMRAVYRKYRNNEIREADLDKIQ